MGQVFTHSLRLLFGKGSSQARVTTTHVVFFSRDHTYISDIHTSILYKFGERSSLTDKGQYSRARMMEPEFVKKKKTLTKVILLGWG